MIEIDHPTVLYFFSSLAQSSAALAALVAVFAVFRLQTNDHQVTERYLEAHHWLEEHFYRDQVIHIPRSLIMTLLADALDQRGRLWETVQVRNRAPADLDQRIGEIRVLLEDIRQAEAVHGAVAFHLTRPLVLWGVLVCLSLMLVAASKALVGLIAWGAIGVNLILLFTAAWQTRRFMQTCLTSPSERRPT